MRTSVSISGFWISNIHWIFILQPKFDFLIHEEFVQPDDYTMLLIIIWWTSDHPTFPQNFPFYSGVLPCIHGEVMSWWNNIRVQSSVSGKEVNHDQQETQHIRVVRMYILYKVNTHRPEDVINLYWFSVCNLPVWCLEYYALGAAGNIVHNLFFCQNRHSRHWFFVQICKHYHQAHSQDFWWVTTALSRDTGKS